MGESTAPNPKRQTIAAIIITKNEEGMIANCISSVRFADEIVVVDTGSADKTIEIARREGAVVIEMKSGNFSTWRNEAKNSTAADWLLYIDADERVTPALRKELSIAVEKTSLSGFELSRKNIHFGKWMEHGGWEQDNPLRLFKREALVRWDGLIHEHAVISGNIGRLQSPLVHLTHRSIRDGLLKSHSWIDLEAKLLVESGLTPVTTRTLLRKSGAEFFRRYVARKGWQDGIEGFIESMQQAINRFFVYARVWELQQKPGIDERYLQIEKEIHKLIAADEVGMKKTSEKII